MTADIMMFGESVLREKAIPVAEVNDEIRELAKSMLETMYAAQGLGLAAEQVSRTEAIFVIDIPSDAEKEECVELNAHIPMPLVVINPQIRELKGQQRSQEGCLSFPEIYAQITRAQEVTVTFTDLAGETQTVTAHGLLARAIQHENDHLDGVLLVDRMSPAQRVAAGGRLKRLRAKAKRK